MTFINGCEVINLTINAEIFMGNKQYPNKHNV